MKNKFEIGTVNYEQGDMLVFGLGLVGQFIAQSQASAKDKLKLMTTLAELEEKFQPVLEEMQARGAAAEKGKAAIAEAVKKVRGAK
jgi:hypothetical protein